MAADAQLVSDLKALRKGRGLFVNNVGERVGHTLRDLCGVTEQDGPVEIRHRVAQRLAHLAGELPDDLRMAVLAAFGVIPDARRPLYQERVDWIATRIGRDPRTARRRIDDGILQLAQLATAPPRVVESAAGWHTVETRVVVMLDHGAEETIEHHRVVAAQDNLTTLDLGSPHASVAYGGTLRSGTLHLPAPLSAGQTHDFALRSRLPAPPPRLVHFPRRRCDFLELRVRFDRNRLPSLVSRLLGHPPRDSGQVPVDPAGEIRLTFANLARGLGYGARWD
jgi:hypothetical protein